MFKSFLILNMLLFYVGAMLSYAQGRIDGFEYSRGDLIEDLLFDYYDNHGFNGSVLVAERGEIIYENTFGIAIYENEEPLDSEIPFYLASLAKQFTAVAVMKLTEEGALNVDDAITKYLPKMPDYYSKVTIHHLLTHTAGLPDYLNSSELKLGMTNQEVYRYLINQKGLIFEPGSRFQYSNSGYVLLSMAIEVATGQTIAEYFNRSFFEPLQMESSFVYTKGQLEQIRVAGYTKKGKLNDYELLTVGDGGFYSTTNDLYRWLEALNNGLVLDQKSLSSLYKPLELSSGRERRYGYGWEIGSNSEGPLVYHTGELAGFRTYMERQLPSGGTIIILTNNSFDRIGKLRNVLVKILDGRLSSLPISKN